MGFEFYKESYAGAIKQISIGEGSKAVTLGGETCYPFYDFEGDMPCKPKIAMEVWDIKPEDWPKAALVPFEDVVHDASIWAKKCISDYGAEIIVLQLKSIDPNGLNASPEDASATVQKVLKAIDVPLIVWGISNAEKDEAVFKKIAEDCQDSCLTLGPVEDKNHKSIGAAAMGYGHLLISSSPIDVNLAKQVNILLENLGMPMDKVLIDPTTGGLGYGLEYSYSVMERLRAAALTQGDEKLQMPIVNNLGNEIWKSKEAKQSTEEAPLLGDPERRGILMEAVSAVSYLMAGSDLLIMRHPEAIRMVKSYIDLIMDGGSSMGVEPIVKRMHKVSIDYAKLSPKPDLTLENSNLEGTPVKKGSSIKKASSVKKVSSKIKATLTKKIPSQENNFAIEVESKKASEDIKNNELDAELKVKMKAKLEAEILEEAKLKLENEAAAKEKAKLKLEAEVKAKIEADRKAKIEAERKAEADAASERRAKEKDIHEKRALERLKALNDCTKKSNNSLSKITPSSEQKENFEKIIDKLQWVHKRVKLYNW